MSPDDLGEAELVITAPEPYGTEMTYHARARTTLGVLVQLVAQAKFRLLLSAPFFQTGHGVSEGPLEAAVRAALRRGVNIDVVSTGESLMCLNIDKLTKHGRGQLRLFQPRLNQLNAKKLGSHAKLCLADGQRAYIGSANFTGPGLGGHVEMGVLVAGEVAKQVETFWKLAVEFGLIVPVDADNLRSEVT